jgi:ABC-2 type transport system permease protein
MRNVFVIAWRDIRAVFVSPIAYVVLTGFLLLAGWFFFNLLGQFNRMVAMYSGLQGYDTTWLNLNDAVIAPLLQNLSVVLLIVVPMLTMRSFAEERSTGTYELLFTSPVRVGEIVLGKFLAGAFLVTLMVGFTLSMPESSSGSATRRSACSSAGFSASTWWHCPTSPSATSRPL